MVNQEDQSFIVVDFGGGTLDISVVELFDNIVEIVSIAGDNRLGGEDFTAAIAEEFLVSNQLTKDTISREFYSKILEDSQRRLEENPLRVLDSKEKEDKVAVENAPSILDFLDEESQAHFDAVRQMLENLGVDYIIDTNMVRGLDYYNHTIFEFITEIEGNDLTVCAGGRYDGLVAYFGGPETAGFGFGLGVERLLLILEKQGVTLPIENALDVYIAVLGEGANVKALELVQALRQQGFKAERDYLNRKLKAQFKSADVFAAKTLITLGESEVESGQVTVKNNQTREEAQVGTGFGILSGIFVLFVMILPTVTFMTTDSLRAVPRHYREASLAMGATRWQTIWRVTLKAARSGIFTAVVFGMARAFGEALAIQMVVGNSAVIPTSLTTPAATLTSVLTMGIGNTVMGTVCKITVVFNFSNLRYVLYPSCL